MNVILSIRYSKGKKAETIEKKRAAREAAKAAEIAQHITLGKSTVEKLEAIEDND